MHALVVSFEIVVPFCAVVAAILGTNVPSKCICKVSLLVRYKIFGSRGVTTLGESTCFMRHSVVFRP